MLAARLIARKGMGADALMRARRGFWPLAAQVLIAPGAGAPDEQEHFARALAEARRRYAQARTGETAAHAGELAHYGAQAPASAAQTPPAPMGEFGVAPQLLARAAIERALAQARAAEHAAQAAIARAKADDDEFAAVLAALFDEFF